MFRSDRPVGLSILCWRNNANEDVIKGSLCTGRRCTFPSLLVYRLTRHELSAGKGRAGPAYPTRVKFSWSSRCKQQNRQDVILVCRDRTTAVGVHLPIIIINITIKFQHDLKNVPCVAGFVAKNETSVMQLYAYSWTSVSFV